MRPHTLVLAATIVAAGVAVAARRREPSAQDPYVQTTVARAVAVPAPPRPPVAQMLATVERAAAAGARGQDAAVQLDLDRALAGRVEPVVEFLTFVQEQRGDTSHLLFVRYDDLDALAAAEGQQVAEFLSRLDQLGVVVSTN